MSGRRLFLAVIAVLVGWGGSPVLAQPEDLTRGKTPAQLFATDCADCHRNPRGLAKADTRTLAGFLRVHYTASRENAAAIAEYLVSLGAGPARPAPPRTAPSAAKPPASPSQTATPAGSSAPAAPAAKPSDASSSKPAEAASEPKPAPAPAPPETPAAAPASPPASPQ